jgi:HAD superfamily hydrolase (TIGR01509 family)
MNPDKPVSVVLFDIGGVLVELGGTANLVRWMETSMDTDALWRWWLSSPDVRAFETGQSSREGFADAIVAQLGLPVSRDTFIEAFTGWPRGVLPGAIELLHDVDKSCRLATLSNTNSLHWPRIIGEMGLSEPFEAHFPSHLTGNIKPDAVAFEQIGEALGCATETILFLDDNQINVDAALDTGMIAHRVTGPEQTRKLLSSLGLLAHSK